MPARHPRRANTGRYQRRFRQSIRPTSGLAGRGRSLSGLYLLHGQQGYRHCPRFRPRWYALAQKGQWGLRLPHREQGGEIQLWSRPPCSQLRQIGIRRAFCHNGRRSARTQRPCFSRPEHRDRMPTLINVWSSPHRGSPASHTPRSARTIADTVAARRLPEKGHAARKSKSSNSGVADRVSVFSRPRRLCSATRPIRYGSSWMPSHNMASATR